MRKRSASGSTVSNDISPKLSSSSKEENSVDDEWRKDDRRYPSKTFFIIFHALLNCRRVKRVEEEYTTLLAICPLSSILYRLMIMYGCVLAHSVAQWWRWWLGFFSLLYFCIQMGAHKVDYLSRVRGKERLLCPCSDHWKVSRDVLQKHIYISHCWPFFCALLLSEKKGFRMVFYDYYWCV